MLRQSIRQRKEYLLRKNLEEKEVAVAEKKRVLKEAIEKGKALPTELRGETNKLRKKLDLTDDRTAAVHTHIDDEYAQAGVKDPKVMVTTSREPSSRLLQFAKEFKLLIPNAQRVNRGGYVMKDLVDIAKSNEVSDIIVLHEHRGEPDGLIISHLPHGPTAYFSLKDVVLRHDLPDLPGTMSESHPHLIFHNFTSKLGARVGNILKFLFPPPAPLGKRVHSFINHGDLIHFRHFNWSEPGKNMTDEDKDKAQLESGGDRIKKSDVKLSEIGPRFTMKVFKIDLGTLDMKECETEWSLKSFFNKPKALLAQNMGVKTNPDHV
eukprot:GDKJ01035316.1.p1 GENE.GDKJ01035316.1~~GDKJ01035316.1.p1  ORF type:complete len:321 (+),score=74.12 GDKJ01035316.1:29-991(+)